MERNAVPARKGAPTKKRTKLSDYGVHLREKQIVRLMSGMNEVPFRNLFAKSSKTRGKTGETMLRFLETRLDNIVRRLGFAVSLKTARQIILHGHIKVNGKDVNIASYGVKPGDKITLDPKMTEAVPVKQGLGETQKRSLRPSFLEFDPQTYTGKLLRWPDRSEMSYPVKEQLLVEFYSK